MSAVVGNWHRAHGCCPACGAATESGDAAHVRRCTACGAEHHPRTNPVTIALVVDGGRVLLGRRASQAPNRFTVFTGFVDPRQSVERAAGREAREEAGVAVRALRCVSSQSRPQRAHSCWLRVPVRRRRAPGDGRRDGARALASRPDVARAASKDRGDALVLPPRGIVAQTLLDGWLSA